jgi:probable F420-dependent oxidoreductase
MLESVGAVVRAADAHGFASLWVGEHVVQFDEYASPYPYGEHGRWPFDDEQPWLEPFAYLALVAAATTSIRLGTGVTLVPQRNPVYTAKSVGTLDLLSGGRVNLGIGVGWSRQEYEALAVPFAMRGARCREYVAVMRALWCDDVASYSGDFYTLPPCRQRPRPLQKPHPPIYFGGESDAALRRVADLGDGWFGWQVTAAQARARVERLGELLAERGRELEDVEVVVGSGAEPTAAHVDEYRDAGVDHFVIAWTVGDRPDESVERLDRLALEVLALELR